MSCLYSGTLLNFLGTTWFFQGLLLSFLQWLQYTLNLGIIWPLCVSNTRQTTLFNVQCVWRFATLAGGNQPCVSCCDGSACSFLVALLLGLNGLFTHMPWSVPCWRCKKNLLSSLEHSLCAESPPWYSALRFVVDLVSLNSEFFSLGRLWDSVFPLPVLEAPKSKWNNRRTYLICFSSLRDHCLNFHKTSDQ